MEETCPPNNPACLRRFQNKVRVKFLIPITTLMMMMMTKILMMILHGKVKRRAGS
jgi:hypothetical protein